MLELKNYMEQLVLQQIDAVMAANQEVCGCDQCRHDIAAMALTILPARYVVTPKGETYTRIKALELQFTVNIITALTEGIEMVKKHPHHEKTGN